MRLQNGRRIRRIPTSFGKPCTESFAGPTALEEQAQYTLARLRAQYAKCIWLGASLRDALPGHHFAAGHGSICLPPFFSFPSSEPSAGIRKQSALRRLRRPGQTPASLFTTMSPSPTWYRKPHTHAASGIPPQLPAFHICRRIVTYQGRVTW